MAETGKELGKKVEVRFGAFACTIEGYDNPVEQMREVLGLMQQMITDTPALADASHAFDPQPIEKALQDDDSPGIVVIRNEQAEPAGQMSARARDSASDAAVENLPDDSGESAEPEAEPAEIIEDQPSAPPAATLNDPVPSHGEEITGDPGQTPTADDVPNPGTTENVPEEHPATLAADTGISSLATSAAIAGAMGLGAVSSADDAQATSYEAPEADTAEPAEEPEEDTSLALEEDNNAPEEAERSLDDTDTTDQSAPDTVAEELPVATMAHDDTTDDDPADEAFADEALADEALAEPSILNATDLDTSGSEFRASDTSATFGPSDQEPLDQDAAGSELAEPDSTPFNIFATPPKAAPAGAVLNIFAAPAAASTTAAPNIFAAPLTMEAAQDRMTETPDPEPAAEPAPLSSIFETPVDNDKVRDLGASSAEGALEAKGTSSPTMEVSPPAGWQPAPDSFQSPEEPELTEMPAVRSIFAAPPESDPEPTLSVFAPDDRRSDPAPIRSLFPTPPREAEATSETDATQPVTPALRVPDPVEPVGTAASSPSRFDELLSRVHGASIMGTMGENQITDEQPAPQEPDPAPDSKMPDAAGIAEMAGAQSVADQLAAAAGWLTLVNGQPRFSRREVMTVLETIPTDQPRELADRIKGFGKLVRSGVLILVDDGVFAMAQTERDRIQLLMSAR